MMKNMQPVAPQDRPKVIAVSISLALALGFVARNLMGTPTLAHSGPSAVATSDRAELTPAPAAPAAPAGTPVAADSPAGPSEGSDPQGWGPVPHHDPFHPIAHPAPAEATAPPAAAPARPVIASRPAAPARLVRIAESRSLPVLPPAETRVPAPAAVDEKRSRPAAAPAPAPSPAVPSAPPSGGPDAEAPVTLTGTVGSGATAVATFHAGDQTVFARPQEMVDGWRVTRIQVGQVWVSQHNVRHLVLVGNALPGSAPVASRPAKGVPASVAGPDAPA